MSDRPKTADGAAKKAQDDKNKGTTTDTSSWPSALREKYSANR